MGHPYVLLHLYAINMLLGTSVVVHITLLYINRVMHWYVSSSKTQVLYFATQAASLN